MAIDISKLDAEADELLSKLMNGESPEAVAPVEQSNPDPVAEQQQVPPQDTPKPEIETAQPEAQNKESEQSEVEKLNERLVNAQRKMTEATTEASSLRRTVADLQNKVADLTQQLSTLQQVNQSDDRINSIGKLDHEYPDLTAPLMAELKSLREQVNKAQVGNNEVKQLIDAEQAARNHWDTVRSVHPDVNEVGSNPAFNDWLATKPARLQAIRNDGTAQEVIDLLSMYKSEQAAQKAPAQEPKPSKIEQAREQATPNVRSNPASLTAKRTYTSAELKAMSAAEYRKHEADIDAAWLEGRVI